MMMQVVQQYFSSLEHFNFPAATKVLKSKQAADIGLPWSKLMYSLQNLVLCEASYYRLTYINAKNVKTAELYTQILGELKALISKNIFDLLPSSPTGEEPLSLGTGVDGSYFTILLQQLCIVVQTRLDMMALYNGFISFIGHNADYLGTFLILEALPKKYTGKIAHPLLHQTKHNINYEVNILRGLIAAQSSMVTLDYKNTTLLLYQARRDMDTWRDSIRKLQQDQAGTNKIQGIQQWQYEFYGSLLAKMSLYFNPVLRKNEIDISGSAGQGAPGVLNLGKELGAKLDPDYITVIDGFVQRNQVHHYSLVYETKGRLYEKSGYSCRQDKEPLSGIGSWPVIFSYPKEPPSTHMMANIISMIIDQYDTLSKGKEPYISMYEDKDTLKHTYFISQVEPSIFQIIIFLEKKRHHDQVIWDFVGAMMHALRNGHIFDYLRQIKDTKN